MNRIYRVIFNPHTGTYQAVSEIARSKTKTSADAVVGDLAAGYTHASPSLFCRAFQPLALVAALGGVFASSAYAAPTGGEVVAGVANIAQAGNITNIHQSSQNAAINWQDFNIKAHETVNFHQPNANAITLNRVLGNEKSVIDGMMNANGKVFIQNPNGTLIGKDAQINVGALVATSAHISDEDFMNGQYRFTDAGTGSVENQGKITVPAGGVVALIAPVVKNSGSIHAHDAHTLLASADSFSITLPNQGGLSYTLDKGTLQGLVDNGGAILANGGRVVLTSLGVDAVKKSVIAHSGIIEANNIVNNNGTIELLGDLNYSRLDLSGSLKAEGQGTQDGVFIETSAAKLNIQDSAHVSTEAKVGKTGTWLIDPKDFTVAASGGDMTGAQVAKGLEANNIHLKSRSGAKDGKGDVIINDEIKWNKNTLTLTADNDIHINKTLSASGSAKLALEYGQGTADGGKSNYYLNQGAKIYLPEGNNLYHKLGSRNSKFDYFVITRLGEFGDSSNTTLQGIKNNLSGNYALGSDIDASETKNWGNGEGFDPIGVKNEKFTGSFLGNNQNINNLVIKKNDKLNRVAMFSDVSNKVEYVRLNNADISNYLGGAVLAAHNSGFIRGVYASGNVKTEYGYGTAGLVIDNRGIISESASDVNVIGSIDVGGLVGANFGLIQNSYSQGDVYARRRTSGRLVGVLAGKGTIENSYATGMANFAGGGKFARSTNGDDRMVGYACHGGWDCMAWTGNIISSYSGRLDKLKDKATFTGWDFDTVWRIKEDGSEYPYLRALTQGIITIDPKTNLGVQTHALNKTYDAKAVATVDDLRAIAQANGYQDIVSITGLKDGDSLDSLGKLSYGGTWQNAKNAGKYSIIPTGLNGGQKYEIKYGEGSLTINKRPLEIKLSGKKTYDNSVVAQIDKNTQMYIIDGSIPEDRGKLGIVGSVVLKGKSVGSQEILHAAHAHLTGSVAHNYDLISVKGVWKVEPKTSPTSPIPTDDKTTLISTPDKNSVEDKELFNKCMQSYFCTELKDSGLSHGLSSGLLFFAQKMDEFIFNKEIMNIIGIRDKEQQKLFIMSMIKRAEEQNIDFSKISKNAAKKFVIDFTKIFVTEALNNVFFVNTNRDTQTDYDKAKIILNKLITDIVVDTLSGIMDGKPVDKALAGSINPVLDGMKDSIKMVLDPEHNVWHSLGDFGLDVMTEAAKSFIEASIDHGVNNPAALAQFKIDFLAQLSLASAKQVVKTGTVYFEASKLMKENIKNQAISIAEMTKLQHARNKFRQSGDVEKENKINQLISKQTSEMNGVANQLGLDPQKTAFADTQLRIALFYKQTGQTEKYYQTMQFMFQQLEDETSMGWIGAFGSTLIHSAPIPFINNVDKAAMSIAHLDTGIYSVRDYAVIMSKQLGLLNP